MIASHLNIPDALRTRACRTRLSLSGIVSTDPLLAFFSLAIRSCASADHLIRLAMIDAHSFTHLRQHLLQIDGTSFQLLRRALRCSIVGFDDGIGPVKA